MNSKNSNSSMGFIQPFYVEGMFIDPLKNQIIQGEEKQEVQPKVMEVLCYLSQHAEQVVTTDELIKSCWPRQFIGDSPVHKCIAQLRKILADDSKEPRFIKTVVKKGYIFIGKVRGLVKANRVSKQWLKGNPYPGDSPYTVDQKDVFFGREQICGEIVEWLKNVKKEEHAWLSIEAPPRAGKTSLVKAGLIPNLSSCPCLRMAPEFGFLEFDIGLGSNNKPAYLRLLELLTVNGIVGNSLHPDKYAALVENHEIEQLQGLPFEGDPDNRTLLFIDQLENVFVSSRDNTESNHVALFFRLLSSLISAKVCVVITAIDDRYQLWLQDLMSHYSYAYVCQLPEFSTTELIDIVHKPVELSGAEYEYNEMNHELLGSEIVKALQFNLIPVHCPQRLLKYLFDRQFNNRIRYQDFKALGGVFGCLSKQVNQGFQSLKSGEKAEFNQLLFNLLTINTEGKVETQLQKYSWQEVVKGKNADLFDKCIRAGILQYSLSNESVYLQLTHESLIVNWSVIASWVDANIERLYVRHDLQIFKGRWLYHQKHPQYLIPSLLKLGQIQDIVKSGDFAISSEEKRFVDCSKLKLRQANWLKNILTGALVFCFIALAGLAMMLHHKNDQLSATRGNAENLISFILYDLKGKLEPLGKLSLLDMVARKTLAYFEIDGVDALTGENLYRWVSAQHLLGQVKIGKNDYHAAELYFQKTQVALERDLMSNQNEKSLELYMLTNYWLGYLAYVEFDYHKTEPFFNLYLEYADKLYAQTQSDKWLLERSYALNNLGSLAENQNLLLKASNYYEQSYQLKLKLLDSEPENGSLRQDMADTRSWQSNIEAKQGRLKSAILYLVDALNQVEQIISRKDDKYAMEQKADLHHKLALYYTDAKQTDKALQHIDSTHNILRFLIQNDAENNIYVKDLIWSYLLQGRNFIYLAKLDRALISLESASSLLTNADPSVQKTQNLIKAGVLHKIYQSHALHSLKQRLSAEKAVNDGEAMFKEGLKPEEDFILFANLAITKNIISPSHRLTASGKNQLIFLKKILFEKITTQQSDFSAIYLYLIILSLLGELEKSNEWLQKYMQSDYKVNHYLTLKLV